MVARVLSITAFLFLVGGASADFHVSPVPLKATEYRVGERVPDFTYTDLAGRQGKLSDFSSRRAIVIAMHRHNCPLSKKYSPVLARMMREYDAADVAFLVVNTSEQATPEQLAEVVGEYGFSAPYLLDPAGEIAKALFAQTTTETLVVDSKLTLRYRGPIDDQHGIGGSLPAPRRSYLKDAIAAVLAGKDVEDKALSSPGCLLGTEAAPETLGSVTFHNRISRLFQTSCQDCHRDGGVAPFALMTYADAVEHKSMIRWMVSEGFMPPWFANPAHGKWKNDRSLTARDKRALLHWLNNGLPEGDPAEAPLPWTWHAGWNIGEPDLVLTTHPFQVPAEGVIEYQYAIVDHGLTEDKWVRAMELRTKNPEVVHHIVVILRDKETRREEPLEVTGFFALYVPGETYAIYPKGLGRKLGKNEELIFQIHYTPNGTAVEDAPELGIVFQDEKPEHVVDATSCYTYEIAIPPHHPNFEIKTDLTFEKRTRLFSFLPHMHLRGKAFRVELEYPDGRRTTVLDVPRYDFNWQLHYELAQPIDVPPGTKMHCTAWYDNSANNPYNPNPEIEVKYGEQTFEEMLFGFFESHPLE